MSIPSDYLHRAYSGVLGKLIGVYLGRPVENWSYERIRSELGDVNYYVNQRLALPLVVTDDDIAGTFIFARALSDFGEAADPSPAQIGRGWLNYLIENRTVLWWGGLGNCTEHTAYLRLKNGIEAPRSGSMAVNGRVVAEQIGAQIFIDGWALSCPGDPERAADLACRAASVSHDGEAIYGAQVVAAMEAMAFVEPDVDKLEDTALSMIPAGSLVHRLMCDLRDWRAGCDDWRHTRERIVERYGYDSYGGNCHIIPNHALIHLGLLYGRDDFQKAMTIVTTSGWDTDCNAGNLGCLMGIRLGLAGLDAGPDWRGPVADRLYLPSADGGGCVTDAAAETYRLVNACLARDGLGPLEPKGGARFHFELPGSVQGFRSENDFLLSVENAPGLGLALRYRNLGPGRSAYARTQVFASPEELAFPGYALYASPTLYPGQTVRALVKADPDNAEQISCGLCLSVYGPDDKPSKRSGEGQALEPGEERLLEWRVPELGGDPIEAVGIELHSPRRADGAVYLSYLTWDGEPRASFSRPAHNGGLWRRAWVNAVDHFDAGTPEPFRIIQDSGRGLLIIGCRSWADIEARADVTPHLAKAAGIALRVQGMRRYYALLLCADMTVRLVKNLDGEELLGQSAFPWELGSTYELRLSAEGDRLRASVGDRLLFDVRDSGRLISGGGVALVCEEGRTATRKVEVSGLRLYS